MNIERKIILASTSPRRKQILERVGIAFDVHGSDYEEELDKDLPPEKLVAYLGQKKAEDVAHRYEDALVIGADTMMEYEGQVLGKPHTKERAREMLTMLSGNQHNALTGYAIIDTKNGKTVSRTVRSKVFFYDLSVEEIDQYVETEEMLDKAGGYFIQGIGSLLVKKIDGDYLNVVGFPISNVWRDLQKFN